MDFTEGCSYATERAVRRAFEVLKKPAAAGKLMHLAASID